MTSVFPACDSAKTRVFTENARGKDAPGQCKTHFVFCPVNEMLLDLFASLDSQAFLIQYQTSSKISYLQALLQLF